MTLRTVGSVAILACKEDQAVYCIRIHFDRRLWRHCTMILFKLFMNERESEKLKKKIDDDRDPVVDASLEYMEIPTCTKSFLSSHCYLYIVYEIVRSQKCYPFM
jgi:hypothetical protein